MARAKEQLYQQEGEEARERARLLGELRAEHALQLAQMGEEGEESARRAWRKVSRAQDAVSSSSSHTSHLRTSPHTSALSRTPPHYTSLLLATPLNSLYLLTSPHTFSHLLIPPHTLSHFTSPRCTCLLSHQASIISGSRFRPSSRREDFALPLLVWMAREGDAGAPSHLSGGSYYGCMYALERGRLRLAVLGMRAMCPCGSFGSC